MKNVRQLVIAAILLFVTLPVFASQIYGTAAPETGNVLLLGFDHWAGNSSLFWNITPVTGGYLYEYAFTHGEKGGLSHLVLEFTQGCASDPLCITRATNDPDGPRTYAAFTQPNFEMPVAIYGVKFDWGDKDTATTNTFSFVSDRAPVYGNIYARDGGNGYAYNQGLTVLDSPNRSYFIARPDGASTVVPEPGTIGLTALAGIAFLAIRRRVRMA